MNINQYRRALMQSVSAFNGNQVSAVKFTVEIPSEAPEEEKAALLGQDMNPDEPLFKALNRIATRVGIIPSLIFPEPRTVQIVWGEVSGVELIEVS
jgi:hypothetical protein